ncbi:MAG: hypothetical protein ACXIVQ_02665 [Acidimicrobiales bacterium]
MPIIAVGATTVSALSVDGVSWWVPPLFLLPAPLLLWVVGGMPHEVVTDDGGVTLVASRRSVHIPWGELTAITSDHPLWLRWRWPTGSVISHAHFHDREELLRTVERCAPNIRALPRF